MNERRYENGLREAARSRARCGYLVACAQRGDGRVDYDPCSYRVKKSVKACLEHARTTAPGSPWVIWRVSEEAPAVEVARQIWDVKGYVWRYR